MKKAIFKKGVIKNLEALTITDPSYPLGATDIQYHYIPSVKGPYDFFCGVIVDDIEFFPTTDILFIVRRANETGSGLLDFKADAKGLGMSLGDVLTTCGYVIGADTAQIYAGAHPPEKSCAFSTGGDGSMGAVVECILKDGGLTEMSDGSVADIPAGFYGISGYLSFEDGEHNAEEILEKLVSNFGAEGLEDFKVEGFSIKDHRSRAAVEMQHSCAHYNNGCCETYDDDDLPF